MSLGKQNLGRICGSECSVQSYMLTYSGFTIKNVLEV